MAFKLPNTDEIEAQELCRIAQLLSRYTVSLESKRAVLDIRIAVAQRHSAASRAAYEAARDRYFNFGSTGERTGK